MYEPLEVQLDTQPTYKPFSKEEKEILQINEDNPLYHNIRMDRVELYIDLIPTPDNIPANAYIDEEHRKSLDVKLSPINDGGNYRKSQQKQRRRYKEIQDLENRR